ncbi:uncharacterized protein LOC109857441 [Pseudomyrmex gracilis]|uniref:uncharacterized protein LOC109857441 n=1 Tax=Pseudomyrmex gracilis TaxID=219809 RepID=UPI00099506F2|nr:uncharacterized protein LOC109857441 [Pseudomyrmex gracilis]
MDDGTNTDATVDDSSEYETTDEHESAENDDDERKKFWKGRSTCEGKALWRIYMKSYAESRLRSGKKVEKKSYDVPKLWPFAKTARDETLPINECFPLGGFQLEQHPETLDSQKDPCEKTRIWNVMRNHDEKREKLFQVESERRLRKRPCVKKKRRRDIFPCDSREDERDNFGLRKLESDFANRKELGRVRAMVKCSRDTLRSMTSRAVGDRSGLVNGDYVIVELTPEGRDRRVYANVVLRGLKGMHIPELSQLRERRNTWKFCFHQAIVALLAKTQLRYKHASSANVDYIYDLAWSLHTHIGAINVKEKQLLDDVVVYNYRYCIGVELLEEMKDVPVVGDVDFNYKEDCLDKQITLSRKDPLAVMMEIGCQKVTDSGYVSVHENVRKIEDWFNNVSSRYRNCIFRTTRFSLAYWKDGLFWYLYNPYRCDEFGFWNDEGYACIVKFCSKDSLLRHLMILLLRAYAYRVPSSSNEKTRNVFDVQIFHVILHDCQLHNPKLLQRGAFKRIARCADECPPASEEDSEEENGDPREPREKSTWLKRLQITWGKCASRKRRTKVAKARWHQYYVEEPKRLFSLWGDMHISDAMFDEANRGMQAYACYMVCAGMTRIMAPEYWNPKILDVIVMCGDRYYTQSKLEAEVKSTRREHAHVSCWNKYLCDRFEIGETLFEARMLPAVCGRLYARSDDCLWKLLERMFADHHFGVLTCDGSCLGLFRFCGAYYMCDVNSHGPPLFHHGNGAAYLIRATSFHKFVTVLVLTINSSERSRFGLNPIEILRVVETDARSFSRARIGERNISGRKTRRKDTRFRSEQKRTKAKR